MKNKKSHDDDFYMAKAIKEARKALLSNDVPIGAVIVSGDKIIGRGYNKVERNSDATLHAELIAIRNALKKIEYKHLLDMKIYVTLEPCAMCAGAIVLSRIKNVVIGTMDPKAGACGSVMNIVQNNDLNHVCDVKTNVMQAECSQLLKEFFKKLRSEKN